MNPSPIPTTVQVAQATGGPQTLVALRFDTPQGSSIFFLDFETARTVAERIRGLASDIVIAPSLAGQLADREMATRR